VPEGRVPQQEQIADLRDSVAEAIAAVTADPNLDLNVRTLLIKRLHDVLWSLDHVQVMGADGIADACDRLAMAVAWAGHKEGMQDRGFWMETKAVIVNGYAIIGLADTLNCGFQAWDAIEPYVDAGMKALGSRGVTPS
jgi:hypothetical protein